MAMKVPTDEQRAIIECDGNIVVTARPGSGKTYTIVEKIAQILPALPDYKGIIAISFTNKASAELRQRCIAHRINAKQSFYGTIDKFYISQIIIPFASHLTGIKPEFEVIKELPDDEKFAPLSDASWPLSEQNAALITELLSKGKILLNLTGETALYILEYVPGAILYLKSRFSHIVIDEYQDCGNIQHQIFTTLVANGLVGIAVGDINQAIFGFTNRFPSFLVSLIPREDFTHFELNKNHRCHPSISEYSLCLIGAAKEIHKEKRVFNVSVAGNEEELSKSIDRNIKGIKQKYSVSNNNDIAILCRKNSTIEKIASALQTPHKVFSDTPLDTDNSDWGRLFREILLATFNHEIYAIDFAEQYFSEEYDSVKYHSALKLSQQIFSCDITSISAVEEDFLLLAELIYPKKKNDISVATLHRILNNQQLLSSFVPASKDEVNIMTLHKSKGLEFDIVFHMDMYKYVIPNEYGTEESQIQDLNLHYVGVTRAKKACYIMIGSKRYRGKQKDYIDAQPSPFLFLPELYQRRRNVIW